MYIRCYSANFLGKDNVNKIIKIIAWEQTENQLLTKSALIVTIKEFSTCDIQYASVKYSCISLCV